MLYRLPFSFPFSGSAYLEKMHAWLQKFLDSFLIGILIMDESCRIRMANAAAHKFFDLPPSSPPEDVTRSLSPENATEFELLCTHVLQNENFSTCRENIFLLESAARRLARCCFTALPAQKNGQKLALVTLTDLSAEKTALEEYELSAQRYRALFDTAADAMMIIAPEGILLDVNRTACKHVNMAREDLIGKHFRTLFTPARQEQEQELADLEKRMKKGKQCTFEALLANPDSPIPVEINSRPFEFQGQSFILGIARDITERKILQARLEYQASTDSLTALNNRRHFLLKAEREFSRFVRYGKAFAMLILDLDRFKKVNDTYGHQTGDALLREFSRQVRLSFRQSDILGRIGGEEFAALLLESDMQRGIETAERLRRRVEKSPLRLDKGAAPYTVSIGVTVVSEHDSNLDAVMRRADAALYRAKRNGRNRVEYENPEQQEQPSTSI
jgi:diguanylate cyclase (GGDEF)-like protein/PAS domain S-box-containing protein